MAHLTAALLTGAKRQRLLDNELERAAKKPVHAGGFGGAQSAAQIVQAICQGQVAVLRSLLDEVEDGPNTLGTLRTAFGEPVLFAAVELGDARAAEDLARALLQAGADPNVASWAGQTPLLRALTSRAWDAARVLLEAGADPNVTDAFTGATPLVLAVAWGHVATVDALLRAGADPNAPARDRQRTTPLVAAITSGLNADVAQFLVHRLLNAGADPGERANNQQGTTPLMLAIQHRLSSLVPVLLKKLHDAGAANALKAVNAANVAGLTAIMIAALSNNHEAMVDLLGAGADVNRANYHGHTPLMLAAAWGHADVVRRLLQAGADPHAANRKLETALSLAAIMNHPDAVAALLQDPRSAAPLARRAHPVTGFTPLMWVAYHGHSQLVRALLQLGADVRAASARGYSALVYAVRAGRVGAVRALITAGADVAADLNTLLYKDGALFGAAAMGRSHVVRAFLAAGADLRSFTFPGTRVTPLIMAADQGHVDIVRILLKQSRAPVNAVDTRGRTALHHAARRRHWGVVTLLLEAGADVNAPARTTGATVLMQAAAAGHLELVQWLLRRHLVDPHLEPVKVDAVLHDGRTNAFSLARRFGHMHVAHALFMASVSASHAPL